MTCVKDEERLNDVTGGSAASTVYWSLAYCSNPNCPNHTSAEKLRGNYAIGTKIPHAFCGKGTLTVTSHTAT